MVRYILLLILVMTLKDPSQEGYLEMESKPFSLYVAKASANELAKYQSVMIMNDRWLIYPPGNRMPIDAEYFEVPEQISLFSNLRTLVIGNVFVNNLPKEFSKLKQLTELHLRLAPTSKLEEIVAVLKELNKVKKINLSGSIISNADYIRIKNEFPKGTVIDMKDEMGNH